MTIKRLNNKEGVETKLHYLDRLNVLIGRGGFNTQSRINAVLDAIEDELGLERGDQHGSAKLLENQRETGTD